jgi:hypothetical protein
MGAKPVFAAVTRRTQPTKEINHVTCTPITPDNIGKTYKWVKLIVIAPANNLLHGRTKQNSVFLPNIRHGTLTKTKKQLTNWAVIDPRWSHKGG